jgi:hypothetical protein
MEAYATEWRKANPDGHFGKMVEDFLSDGPEGFEKFFNERMDEPFELDEDSKLDEDSEALVDAMVEDVAPGLVEFTAAVSKTRIKNQREAKDGNYLVALKAQFLEGLGELAIKNIINRGEKLTSRALDAELDTLVEMKGMVPILETLVAGDVAEPDPGLDVNRLTGDARVARHLRTAFRDEGVWVEGKLVEMKPDFNDAMVDWVTEYRKDNPDASFDKMVRDFISVKEDSPGFKPFYKKSAEAEAVSEQAPLTPRQKSLADERLEAARESEEEALADFPDDVLPKPPSKSRVNSMLEARELIPALRQELQPIPGWEESDEYNKDSTVREYRKGKEEYEESQREGYEARDIVGQKNKARPMGYDFLALPDEMVAGLIEKGDTGYGRFGFNYGDILRDTLRYRMEGGLIDGKPSYITLEELKSGELRMPHRNVLVPVPKAELNPRDYLMVADKEQLDSYTSEDWMTLYGNLDDTVKATLDRYVEAGAAADIPELLEGLQEDLLYLHYRIDLEDNQRTGPSKQMQGESPKEDPERLRMLNGLEGREIGIVEYHEDTIRKGLVGRDEEGRPVTVFSMGVTIPEDYKGEPHPLAGKYVLIPGYNKKTKEVMRAPEAYKLFEDEIFEGKWPTYDSAEELDERSKAIHEIMDYDADHLSGAK